MKILIKVDKHISDLLYEHDCVIVPDFGGFVANYAPAKIHPTQHIFIPPTKNIIFNKNLKNNDGLLANHIAIAEKTSYPTALKYIDHFTANTNSLLKNGSKVKIDEVGTLYLDVERNLQFEPDTTNFFLDAFGLSRFQSPPIKRDNIGKRIEKEFKDRAAIPADKKKINIKRYVTLAISLPLIFGMIWIPLKTDLLKNINYSSLNPFTLKGVPKNIIHDIAKTKWPKINDVATEPVPDLNDTIKHPIINLTTNVSKVIAAEEAGNTIVEPVIADSTRVVITNDISNLDLKFHLITGCFQIQDNANRFVKELQNQNITASILGKRNGLYIVSSGDYATPKEAFIQLRQLKKSQPDAWLLKK